jgi:LmbE family N-acetylglucosaminyl deacetylase
VRADELRLAAAELGVTDVIAYDRGDGTLTGQSFEDLVGLALDEISGHRPDVIITFGPDGGYHHPDHVRTSEVATEAAARAGVAVYHAAFPRQSQRLTDLLVEWLTDSTDWFRGTPDFAHAMMMLADGSSMLGLASDHIEVRFSPRGTFVIEQGERAHELFLIPSGEVDVVVDAAEGGTKLVDSAGPGTFFGERGLAHSAPRAANVVARSAVTSLVLTPSKPSQAAGRGLGSEVAPTEPDRQPSGAITDHVLDVSRHAHRKIRALAQHRSQYALSAEMFPPSIVTALLGTEYFNRAR